jgi:hypothetical protein
MCLLQLCVQVSGPLDRTLPSREGAVPAALTNTLSGQDQRTRGTVPGDYCLDAFATSV